MTVVFYECFDEERCEIEKIWPSSIKASFFKNTIQECGHSEPAGDIISIRTQSKIPPKWAKQVKAVVSRSTGYDHLLSFIQNTRVPCAYLPQYCKQAVAQQAVIMTLALWRKIPQQIKAVKTFCRDGLTGSQWEEKNLLVVGVGRIGREIVRIAKSLGINVCGTDTDPREKDVDYLSLEQGLVWADAIVCAVSLNETTKELFCLECFKKMERRPVFVNISRGEVSPLKDVGEALKQGILSGAGIDVYDNEPLFAQALRQDDGQVRKKIDDLKAFNVLLTPHNAFNTQEAVREKAAQTCRTIVEFIEKGCFSDENSVKK